MVEWRIVPPEEREPDPDAERALNYLCYLGAIADGDFDRAARYREKLSRDAKGVES